MNQLHHEPAYARRPKFGFAAGGRHRQSREVPVYLLVDLRVEDWEEMIDVNIKGVLYGIAAALPVFRERGIGHFVNIASTAAHRIAPTMLVYSGTKFAVRAISEGLREEAGDKLRVTIISPGFKADEFR